MKTFRHHSLILCLLFLSPIAFAADDEKSTGEWQTLFNGKDLTGWRANTDPAAFTVVDGAIRANATTTKTKSHLFYVGDRKGEGNEGLEIFKNFELELSARCEPDSNSGIFIHTDLTPRDKSLHLGKGYEIQLNNAEKEKRKTGSLYDVVDLAESPVDESEWFRVHIIVRGKRITVALNGKQVIDYTEPDDVERPPKRAGRLIDPNGGAIALQGHDPKSVFYFKDIRVRRLP